MPDEKSKNSRTDYIDQGGVGVPSPVSPLDPGRGVRIEGMPGDGCEGDGGGLPRRALGGSGGDGGGGPSLLDWGGGGRASGPIRYSGRGPTTGFQEKHR